MKVDLFDFGDLLMHATTLGYGWNEAHRFFENDRIIPFSDSGTTTFYQSDVDQYGWSEDTVKILKSFFETKHITEFVMSM